MHYFRIVGQANKTLPRAVFFQCTWIMKDYDRLEELVKLEREEPDNAVVFYASSESGFVSESVMAEAKAKIAAIDRALYEIPEEYRQSIFEYYAHEKRLPDEASENTWKKWKKAFIESLAQELNLF